MAVPRAGSVFDRKDLSPDELERLTRKFVDEIHDFIGPDKDISGSGHGHQCSGHGLVHESVRKVPWVQIGLCDRQNLRSCMGP